MHHSRRKRKSSEGHTLPRNFHYGGNILDPLGLNALLDSADKKGSESKDDISSTQKHYFSYKKRRRLNSHTKIYNENVSDKFTEGHECSTMNESLPRYKRRNSLRAKSSSPMANRLPVRSRSLPNIKYQRMASPSQINYREKDFKYRYGNILKSVAEERSILEQRLGLFKRTHFQDRDVLHIGCNNGNLLFEISRKWQCKSCSGVDIQGSLIRVANNQRNKLSSQVQFRSGDFCPDSLDVVKNLLPRYDCIIMLSVVKWMHLNHGDVGVKLVFTKVFKLLRPGGLFFLEPPSWISYKRSSRLTPHIQRHFQAICFFPPRFKQFLMNIIGFQSCKLLGFISRGHSSKKRFKRPMWLFQK